ncbi:hypothetical protein C8R45DRAFT_245487 [Mycena sanguinolenta]|nr:hypothetical protein C8R45DRAFT_245487 [Mycena sanguinolenta]
MDGKSSTISEPLYSMHLRLSDNSLPDEIISEILSPALKVSDSDFSDTISDVSPFANYSESSSAFLLVGKSWLRVGTPLLYSVVILRSEAQATALSVTLSANKDLGKFIKKLRVEGGYGLPMHIILSCSPNIADLFLTLKIYSSDNTSGLCDGLQLISPTRLILRDLSKPLKNKMTTQLFDALGRAIPNWERLGVLECALFYGSFDSKIFQSLINCKRLHTLAIFNSDPYHVSYAYEKFDKCPLKCIQIKAPMTREERRFLKTEVPVKLLKFTNISVAPKLPLMPPSLNPSFTPMASAPTAVHDKIWSCVLYFAMCAPELARVPSGKGRWLAPLSVSKTFNRLGLPYYYAHVVLRNSLTVTKFAVVLLKNPSIGPHVRSLAMEYWDRHITSATRTAVSAVLSRTTGLERFSQSLRSEMHITPEGAIPWDAFEAIAGRSGSTLCEFSVRIEAVEATSPTIFGNFGSLRTVEWKCETSFLLINIPENAFQQLEDLRLSFASPSLVKICLSRPFFHDKNKGLIAACENFFLELMLQCLPNLRELTVDCLEWPTNEREITKSCCVPWAEILLKRGIDLTDSTGAKWRPRLKVK